MVDINKIDSNAIEKHIKDAKSALDRKSLFDIRMAAKQIQAFNLPAVHKMMKEQSAALKAFAPSGIANAIEANSIYQKTALSKIADMQLTSFKSMSYALNKLNTSEMIAIREQAAIKHHIDSIHKLVPTLDIDSIRNHISSATKMRELIECTAFRNQYVSAIQHSSLGERVAESYSNPPIYITSNGTVQIDDENISTDELTSHLYHIFTFINNNSFTDNFFNYLKKFKEPTQKVIFWLLDKIIISFIMGVAIHMYAPTIQEYLDTHIYKSKQDVVKHIKKLPAEIDFSNLPDYRVVTASHLHVRKHGNRHSTIIANIKRGQLVKILQSNKSWALIEVTSEESEATIKGWVFTRYITKLKR